jgi:uncharacterized protein (TIGR02996 family)
MAKGAREPAYVRHTGGAAWGVGVLVAQTADQRTYLFADGVRRSFKEEFCRRFIEPADAPSAEDVARLERGVSAGGVATPKAIHLELEAQIAARPDDPQPWLVYADWLQQRDDPRGKLIALQYQLALEPRSRALRDAERALLDEHGAYLLPERLHKMLRLPRRRGEDAGARCEVTWRCGFLASVRLARKASPAQPAIAELADELLGHPSAHFLRRLVIGPLGTAEEYNLIGVVEAIAQRGHARLAELVLGDFAPAEMELAFSRAGNVAPLLGALPGLERLVLRAGSLRFESAVRHAGLRELSVTAAALSERNVARLLAARLPALEALELSCPGLALTDVAFREMLRGTQLPKLRRLALRHTVGTLRALEEILASPLGPRLEVLELDRGDLDDRAAHALATVRAPQLAHLSRLDVSGNPMSEVAAERLSRLCGSVAAAPGPRGAIDEDDAIARAPDARSVTAARAIARPERWMVLGRDHDRVWGEYEGGDNYYVWARLDDRETGCNCASPKDPCKHALALLLLAAREALPPRPMPDAFARRSGDRRV